MQSLNTDAVAAEVDGDKQKGRERAAQQWVAHYLAVDDLITELVQEGHVDPGKLNQTSIEKLLVESWELKAAEKDDAVATKMVERYGGKAKAA